MSKCQAESFFKVNPAQMIEELTRSIVIWSNTRASLRAALKLGGSEFAVKTVQFEITLLTTRIERAQLQIGALENCFFAEIQTSRRRRKYPPIPAVTKSVIRYADE